MLYLRIMDTKLPTINDLWNYNQPESTRGKFEQLLPLAQASGDKGYELELLTQMARTYSLMGQFKQAHAVLDQVAGQMAGDDVIEVRYLLERGRTFNSDKQPEKAVPLFHRAFTLADGLEEGGGYATDALHMLGIATPPDERLSWNLKAIAYAEQSADERAKKWLGSLYNNTGWSYFDLGEYETALDLFHRALILRQKQGDESNIRVAKYCIAKTKRLLGQPAKALVIQETLINRETPDGFTEEEIGECLMALGRVEQAKPYFQIAYDVLSQINWVAEDKPRMARLRQFLAQ